MNENITSGTKINFAFSFSLQWKIINTDEKI